MRTYKGSNESGSKTEKVWRVLDARFPWVPQGCPWSFLVPVHQNWTLFQVSGQIDGIFNSGAGQLPSAWPDSHTQLGCFWSDVGSPCVLGRSWSILRASFMHPLVPALMQQRQTHFCMWKNTALLLSARLKRRKVWKPFFFFFLTHCKVVAHEVYPKLCNCWQWILNLDWRCVFPGVTTYVLTLRDLLLQQSSFSKYSGQISPGLKFSDFLSVLSFLAWAA